MGIILESATEPSPKARHRFGFRGKRPKLAQDTAEVSTDELLESLTRQASSQVGFGEYQQKGFDVLVDDEDYGTSFGETSAPIVPVKFSTNRSLGRFAFVFMFLGGLFLVWLYSSGMKTFNLASLTRLVQTSGIRSVFADPTQILVISLVALVIALWVAHKRKNRSLRAAI